MTASPLSNILVMSGWSDEAAARIDGAKLMADLLAGRGDTTAQRDTLTRDFILSSMPDTGEEDFIRRIGAAVIAGIDDVRAQNGQPPVMQAKTQDSAAAPDPDSIMAAVRRMSRGYP